MAVLIDNSTLGLIKSRKIEQSFLIFTDRHINQRILAITTRPSQCNTDVDILTFFILTDMVTKLINSIKRRLFYLDDNDVLK